MEKKFTVLRVIATLYKIVGVLIALGTILSVILEIVGSAAGSTFMNQIPGLAGSGPAIAFLSAIATFIGGGLAALGVFAIGEAIYVLINLEENTRFTAILMRDRFYPQQMPASDVTPLRPITPPSANPTYPPPAEFTQVATYPTPALPFLEEREGENKKGSCGAVKLPHRTPS